VVERGFAFLKKKEFFVDALFLKSPERIEALLMVMAISLMVYTALEYKIRHKLEANNLSFKNQQGIPTSKPTARWIFQCFEGIQCLYLHETNQAIILNLTDQHRLIISLLGRSFEKIYFLGG
jgi:transposase